MFAAEKMTSKKEENRKRAAPRFRHSAQKKKGADKRPTALSVERNGRRKKKKNAGPLLYFPS